LLQNSLGKFGRNETSLVILHSHFKLEQFLQTLKVTTLHQLPIVTLEYPDSDNFLDDTRQIWHVSAFENFTARFVQYRTNLQARLDCAQLLNTSVGNVHGDVCMQSLDLLFARELMSANFVLWYSETAEPDVGSAYSNDLISMPGDPFSSIAFNRSGTFLSRCLDYRTAHLSTSAIIECQTLIDQFLPQHAIPDSSNFSSMPSLDAVSLTSPVFAVLSRFLSSVVSRCENETNILSSMIGHLGTWLSSSNSAFYDPAVHSVFHHFLNVLFNQMIAHFETHELPVVYADQSRVIINVGTYSPDIAFAELKNKALLRWIDFSVINDFCKLVWIDEFNFQGILPDDQYLSSWNVSRFLPPKHSHALADLFNDLLLAGHDELARYFHSIAENFYKLADEARYAASVTDNPLRNPADQTRSDFLLLVSTFFRVVDNLGDENLQHEVIALRANILKILGIGEFEPRARFVDPSLSLVVPSVLCRHCLSVRNIDVLRDEEILSGSWICAYCQQPYDTRIFERSIYEDFVRRYEAFMAQDLRCSRCVKVQSRRISGTCEDGGTLRNSISREELLARMKVVKVTAQKHDFMHLVEVVDDFLGLI
jgi:DNA polymerase epsilon subunit 1